MENNFDVIVIGSGPGGYVCAIRSAQLGLKTACVEMDNTLGGVCLNRGCIPSKSLLNSSELYHKAQIEFNSLGIEVKNIKLNLLKMMDNKKKTVQDLTKGIEFLFKKNKVIHLKGKGSIAAKDIVTVTSNSKKKTSYKTKNIVIATGSEPTSLPGINIDEKIIVSSTGALSFQEVPKELIVIGGGYIGLELSSVWKRLGSKVTVIEFLDHIIPGMDKDISREFLKILGKQGITFKLNSKVTGINIIKNKAVIDFTNNKTAKRERIETDKVLVAVGRKPNISKNISELGIKLDSKNKIDVNSKFETSIKNIYAIGDIINKGPMLAHKAEDEGIATAEIIAGQAGHVNYDVIPAVIYTSPEVATVGKTEEQLEKEGIKYKIGKFPFLANSRAKVNNKTEGFVKIIADEKTDKVLGVSIISDVAGTLIAELALAMEFGASSEDIARTCHAHPTHSEAVKEAALAIDKRPIHF
ncbi:MAG: dihydrolipoyl dehydrogenase [Candidatus Pelagibacterales bacterium]|nr:MAG: dihydrolipoyl dehydrogenase [Pelagibacterales bacterium]